MLTYLARRIMMAIIVILLAMTFMALLVRLIPGNPVTTILGPHANAYQIALVTKQMGLKDSAPVQVWNFIRHAVTGNLGVDFINQVPVTTLIGNALPYTIVLAVASLALAVVVGLPLGVYASAHPGSVLDRVIGIVSVGLITIPPYVSGLLLVLLFSVSLHTLPAIGAGSLSNPGSYLEHLILPAVALAITWIGYLARLIRAGMLEVLGSNYIRTARSLGMRERVVFYKYALKNAIIPTVAVLGVGLGTLMGGAIFVEVIFARPGLGTLIFNAIEARNYPVVRGGILVVAILFVTANLLADLSYRLLDPRIRIELGRD
jgi:peptide/nickel transport system permease protein